METQRLSTALAACFAFALLAGASPQAPRLEGRGADPLPVIDLWYLEPAEGRTGEMEGLIRQMHRHAQVNFADQELAFYERRYADQPVHLLFSSSADLRADDDARRSRGDDGAWMEMFNRLVETAAEDSHRVILFPVAGVLGDEEPRWRFMLSCPTNVLRRPPARRCARDLVEHLNSTYDGVAARAYVDELGTPAMVYVFVDYAKLWTRPGASLAEQAPRPDSWESVRLRMLEDERYEQLMQALAEVVVEEEVEELVLRNYD